MSKAAAAAAGGSPQSSPAIQHRAHCSAANQPARLCGHAQRQTLAAVHRRGCASAYVCRRHLVRNVRLQTRARGPAASPGKGCVPRPPASPHRPTRRRATPLEDWRENFGPRCTSIQSAGGPSSRQTKQSARATTPTPNNPQIRLHPHHLLHPHTRPFPPRSAPPPSPLPHPCYVRHRQPDFRPAHLPRNGQPAGVNANDRPTHGRNRLVERPGARQTQLSTLDTSARTTPGFRPPASPEPTQPGRRTDERGEPLSCSPPSGHRIAARPAGFRTGSALAGRIAAWPAPHVGRHRQAAPGNALKRRRCKPDRDCPCNRRRTNLKSASGTSARSNRPARSCRPRPAAARPPRLVPRTLRAALPFQSDRQLPCNQPAFMPTPSPRTGATDWSNDQAPGKLSWAPSIPSRVQRPDSARRPPRSRPNQAGGRTRGENPSRALPRKATARRGRRLQTFTKGGGPACGNCAAGRADGHVSGGLPAVALAAVLSVRRRANIFRIALRAFEWRATARRLAMRRRRPAGVTASSAMPARTRRNQHIGPDSRYRSAAGSAQSAFPGPSGR